MGPYFPKIFTESETGTHVVYELYSDIMAIRNIKSRYRVSMTRDRRDEDIPEEDGYIGLSCYKYTRNEIYHFNKSPNHLLSPDSSIFNAVSNSAPLPQ